jgi:hypothetical protein
MASTHNKQAENEPVPNRPSSAETVRKEVSAVMMPGNFFAGPSLQLHWFHEHEEVFWETFRGRVLGRSQTRQRRRFEAWNIREVNPAVADDEPILSVKFDTEAGDIHVTRSILVYGWEAFADEQGAIQSQETVKRNRELIGSLSTGHYRSAEQLLADLNELLFLAVVGTSRLPLTSEESPHPAFTFGQWMFCYRPNAGTMPFSDPCAWIASSLQPKMSWRQQARLLEFVLRASKKDEIERIADAWRSCWLATNHSGDDMLRLIRILFEEISLSPYTDFVTKFLDFLNTATRLQLLSAADKVDCQVSQIRLLWRHLNAFDLVRFHHRGANYPDALLLDELLRSLIALADADGESFLPQTADTEVEIKKKRRRRGALRLGWLLRRHYAGLAVPEMPTSPGENSRVLPAPFRRMPEDEILNPAKRSQQLFETELQLPDSVRNILVQSIADLDDAGELQELGTALFLDRPLGVSKRVGEPDRTPLLSYVAFSRKLAREHLRRLGGCSGFEGILPLLELLARRLESAEFSIGVSGPSAMLMQRPGVASLEDSHQAADDFVFLRTTRRSLQELLDWFDLSALDAFAIRHVLVAGKCLLIREAQRPDHVCVYDQKWRNRMLLSVDLSGGFLSRPAAELPRNGLEVIRASDDANFVASVRLPLKRAVGGASISR